MAIRIITGGSGQGKTEYIVRQVIRESLEHQDGSYFVIVPEQFSLEMQKKMIASHPRHGFINIDVLSFHRLAWRIFEEAGFMPPDILEDLGVSMMLRKILSEKEEEFGHPIYIISDEPYREIVFEGVDAPFIASHYNNTLTCYSFSKSLSLPGERIGYIAVNPACGDSELLVEMFGQISRGIGHNCPPSIIQLAVSKCLYETSDLSVYETNKNILYTELTKIGFDIVEPGGTFYMFPKSLEEDAVAFCNKAKELDLIIVPSNTFGVNGHFRISYCIPTEKVERSIAAFQKLADMYL